jgi:hypothetical protein
MNRKIEISNPRLAASLIALIIVSIRSYSSLEVRRSLKILSNLNPRITEKPALLSDSEANSNHDTITTKASSTLKLSFKYPSQPSPASFITNSNEKIITKTTLLEF